MKSILLGLDAQSHRPAATEVAVGWAGRFSASVAGMAVVDEPGICRPASAPIGGGAFKEHSDKVRLRHATEQIDEILRHFEGRASGAGIRFQALKRSGDPAEQLLREAARHDLVVLPREFRFRFATQNEPCDTLQQVLKSAPRPVVAVSPTPVVGDSVVVAYDGSVQAARALQAFQQSGLGDLASVRVVVIGPDADEVAWHAGCAMEFLARHGVTGTPYATVTSDRPAAVLLDRAREFGAGLVVMGAYGQSTVREFFFGSVTRTLLKEMPAPLFLYH